MQTLTNTELSGAAKLDGPAMAAECDGWTKVHQSGGISFFAGNDSPNDAHLVDGADFMEDGYFDYDDPEVGQHHAIIEEN
jgi:hypothetical protein